MSFFKAKKAFQENARQYLSAKDGHFWNTNAGLLNLCEALESELGDLQRKVHSLEQQVQNLERAARR
jgi:hypothetical protein